MSLFHSPKSNVVRVSERVTVSRFFGHAPAKDVHRPRSEALGPAGVPE